MVRRNATQNRSPARIASGSPRSSTSTRSEALGLASARDVCAPMATAAAKNSSTATMRRHALARQQAPSPQDVNAAGIPFVVIVTVSCIPVPGAAGKHRERALQSRKRRSVTFAFDRAQSSNAGSARYVQRELHLRPADDRSPWIADRQSSLASSIDRVDARTGSGRGPTRVTPLAGCKTLPQTHAPRGPSKNKPIDNFNVFVRRTGTES